MPAHMTTDELQKGQRVQFRLNGQLVQGVVIGDKEPTLVIMRDAHRCGDWRPLFIPLHLLDHAKFYHLDKPTMPLYNPIMEDLLRQIRQGDTEF